MNASINRILNSRTSIMQGNMPFPTVFQSERARSTHWRENRACQGHQHQLQCIKSRGGGSSLGSRCRPVATELAKKQASFCKDLLFQWFKIVKSRGHCSLGSCCRLFATKLAKKQSLLCQDLSFQCIKSRVHSSCVASGNHGFDYSTEV